MRAGGEMIWHTMNGNRLLVLSKKRKDRSRSRPRPFVKPAEPKKQKVEKPISPKKNEDEDDLYDEMMRWWLIQERRLEYGLDKFTAERANDRRRETAAAGDFSPLAFQNRIRFCAAIVYRT